MRKLNSPKYSPTLCARTLLPLVCSIVLCGCGETVKPVLFNRDPPQSEWTEDAACPDPSPVPVDGFQDEAQRLMWSANEIATGDLCRINWKALRKWALNPPKVK